MQRRWIVPLASGRRRRESNDGEYFTVAPLYWIKAAARTST
jgi:hypothetical protein